MKGTLDRMAHWIVLLLVGTLGVFAPTTSLRGAEVSGLTNADLVSDVRGLVSSNQEWASLLALTNPRVNTDDIRDALMKRLGIEEAVPQQPVGRP